MTTYTTIANSAIDQDSPVTQTLMQALRDNPIAITEGASGAPRIVGEALNLYITEGSASRTTSGTSTILTVTDLDNLDYILVNNRVGASTSDFITITLRYETSTDNGSTFASPVTYYSKGSSGGFTETVAAAIDCSGSVNAVRFSLVVSESGTSSGSATLTIFGFGIE